MIRKWGIGGSIIVAAAILYIIALFMPWIDLFFIKMNGFQRQGYLVLALFIYPLYTVFRGKPMNIIFGLTASILTVALLIYYLATVPSDLMGQSIHPTGSGLYTALAASIIFVIGSFIKGIESR